MERQDTAHSMSHSEKSVAPRVAELIEPALEDMGFELVDVEFLSRQGRWVLQLFIDKEGGVTIEDCARVSREFGDLIDSRDIIDHAYVLEVSSPGIDRPLKKIKDFQKAVGSKVKVRTGNPVDGRANFTGYLETMEGDLITMNVEGVRVSFRIGDLEKANLVYEF